MFAQPLRGVTLTQGIGLRTDGPRCAILLNFTATVDVNHQIRHNPKMVALFIPSLIDVNYQ
ncbi:MAG: hypothetical protein ABIT83_02215 [Massilia sp.]